MNRSLVLMLAVTVLGTAACDDDPMEPQNSVLELAFAGSEPLGNGFHYEGWAIIDGTPVTTGKFNVDGGDLVTTAGVTSPTGPSTPEGTSVGRPWW